MNHYLTTSMSEAAFLMTLGHEPLEVRSSRSTGPHDALKTFVFEAHCGELAQAYYRDAEVSARRYQAAYQEVRRMLRK